MNEIKARFGPIFFCLLVAVFTLPAIGAVRSEVITHKSDVLGVEKNFYLFYPANYNPKKNYPVLYLLHGAGGNYRDWSGRGVLGKALENFEMFVVLPDGNKNSWYVDSIDPTSQYETYIIKELIPYIDSNYPTIQDRKARAISGLSMGGHGAVTLAIKYPDLFASASSLSGIMDITRHPGEWELDKHLGSLSQNRRRWEANCALSLVPKWRGEPHIALFISCGLSDFALQENRDFHKVMQNFKIPHLYVEHPGSHSWDYWYGHIEEHLLFHNYIFTH